MSETPGERQLRELIADAERIEIELRARSFVIYRVSWPDDVDEGVLTKAGTVELSARILDRRATIERRMAEVGWHRISGSWMHFRNGKGITSAEFERAS
jgi:hypothetical protein